MPGTTCTSSQPSWPKLSRICLVACTSTGAVMYSHLVMWALYGPLRWSSSGRVPRPSPAWVSTSSTTGPGTTVGNVDTLDASGPLPDAVLRYDERPDAVVDVFLSDRP